MSSSREIMEHVCLRPAIYCGSESLEAINTLLFGYRFALELRGLHDTDDWLIIPREFYHWVLYRLRLKYSPHNWCGLIREHTSSEREAIDKFLALLIEFRNRQPHFVAKLGGFQKEYSTVLFRKDGSQGLLTKPYPQALSLVTYTDDPGCFVYSDTEIELPPDGYLFVPDIGELESQLRIHRDQLTIVDPAWNFGLRASK